MGTQLLSNPGLTKHIITAQSSVIFRCTAVVLKDAFIAMLGMLDSNSLGLLALKYQKSCEQNMLKLQAGYSVGKISGLLIQTR